MHFTDRVLEKLIVNHLMKIFPAFYGIRKLITVFTRSCHWSLSWATWTQFTTFHTVSLRYILIISSSQLCQGLVSGLFPLVSPTKILYGQNWASLWLRFILKHFYVSELNGKLFPAIDLVLCFTEVWIKLFYVMEIIAMRHVTLEVTTPKYWNNFHAYIHTKMLTPCARYCAFNEQCRAHLYAAGPV
jgi:hypothetical protein